jgi:anti-anti-sigma factor
MRDAPLTVSTQPGRHAETMVVQLDGPLTLPNIFSFQERVAFLRAHSLMSTLIVDLAQTPYMDSAGLGCITNCYVSATKNGKRFLLAGANERIAALLETAHVDTLIPSYPTMQTAEAAMDLS